MEDIDLPASWNTVRMSNQESLHPRGFQCDRTGFLRHVRQRIAEWNRGGAPFCVLLAQVEQDERILDSQSQRPRDDVYDLAGRILNGSVREMDLISQYDHACFSVLLPSTVLKEGVIVAERVRQIAALSEPPAHRSPTRIRLNTGVAEVAVGDDPNRLLERAEAAIGRERSNVTIGRSEQWLESLDAASVALALALAVTPGTAGCGDVASTT